MLHHLFQDGLRKFGKLLQSSMSISRCCCGACEEYFADSFDRASIGTDWTTQSGSWSISSNQLTTSSSSAAITCDTVATETKYNATVAIKGSTAGDVLKVFVDWSDSNNHSYVEVTFGASSATIKIYEVIAGTPTQLGLTKTAGSVSAGTAATITVCFTETHVGWSSATLGHDLGVLTGSANGTETVGLGTGSMTGTATFDDFSINGNKANNTDCDSCNPVCNDCDGDGLGPTAYKVVLSGTQNGTNPFFGCTTCADYDGTYIVPFSDIDGAGFCGYETSGDYGCESNTDHWQIRILAGAGVNQVTFDKDQGHSTSQTNQWEGTTDTLDGDCLNKTNIDMTLDFGGNDYCDFDAATLTVTAIP